MMTECEQVNQLNYGAWDSVGPPERRATPKAEEGWSAVGLKIDFCGILGRYFFDFSSRIIWGFPVYGIKSNQFILKTQGMIPNLNVTQLPQPCWEEIVDLILRLPWAIPQWVPWRIFVTTQVFLENWVGFQNDKRNCECQQKYYEIHGVPTGFKNKEICKFCSQEVA